MAESKYAVGQVWRQQHGAHFRTFTLTHEDGLGSFVVHVECSWGEPSRRYIATAAMLDRHDLQPVVEA